MRFRHHWLGALLTLVSGPAFAQSSMTSALVYDTGNPPNIWSPGSPGPLTVDTSGNLRINCITGCSGGSGSAGSVTAAGVNGSLAQAMQGINGGVPLPITAAPVTPAAGTGYTITTGGTAVTLITGPVNGGYVVNGCNATQQGGIAAAETVYLDPVGTPGSTDSGANGTTAAINVCGVYTVPPLASGVTLKANAATSGHLLTVVKW